MPNEGWGCHRAPDSCEPAHRPGPSERPAAACRRRRAWVVPVLTLALPTGGCTLLTATPPRVQVQSVALRGIGLLEQSLAVTLCVSNPNDAALAFRHVTTMLDVAGSPLATGESVLAVRLPPHAATTVPFAVTTTVANLGPQLLAVLQSGSLAYRIHGTVQLDGALPVTLPYGRAGRLDAATIGPALLADAGPPGMTDCPAPDAPAPQTP